MKSWGVFKKLDKLFLTPGLGISRSAATLQKNSIQIGSFFRKKKQQKLPGVMLLEGRQIRVFFRKCYPSDLKQL